jgi:hypothetical protein
MNTMRDDTSDSRPPRSVDADTARSRQQLIGRRLRDMYDTVLDEGVPDDFEQLLNALDNVEESDTETTEKTKDKAEKGMSDG